MSTSYRGMLLIYVKQGMDQAGFRLAVHICNSSADKLQRHVCQYFTEVIVEHTQEDDVDYEEVSAAHNLIKNLHAHCPGLLHNIIPQLEEELRAQQHELRTLATRTLGDMFAEKGGRELLKKYPSTWEFWLGRRNDKDTSVRLTWVEATQALLVKHSEPRKPIEGKQLLLISVSCNLTMLKRMHRWSI
jgi:sister chromatid cohesion protein PDS5